MGGQLEAGGGDLILIGMPGAGKSTLGRHIAERADLPFRDTDDILEHSSGDRLQSIIDQRGLEAFKELEEQCLCALEAKGGVIATGGSVVYSEAGMAQLRTLGQLVFLDVDLEELKRRLGDARERGLVRPAGQDLKSLFHERSKLYLHYADHRLVFGGQSIAAMGRAVAAMVGLKPWPEP